MPNDSAKTKKKRPKKPSSSDKRLRIAKSVLAFFQPGHTYPAPDESHAIRKILYSSIPGSQLMPTLLREARMKDAAKKKRGEVKKMRGGRVTRPIDGRATKGLTRGSGRT